MKHSYITIEKHLESLTVDVYWDDNPEDALWSGTHEAWDNFVEVHKSVPTPLWDPNGTNMLLGIPFVYKDM